jgi:hypothetical protein
MIFISHPNLEAVDEVVRIVGWPATVSALVWAVRKWDAASLQWKSVRMSTDETLKGLQEIKTNHLAHLQTGIEQVAKSNDAAVAVLQDISTGISVLVDRTKR